MALIIPNVGKIPCQELICGNNTNFPFEMRLFQNDFTPVAATVLASFTEATFSGYVAKTLANPVTDPVLDPANRAVTRWDLLTWVKNGGTSNSIFGYYVLDDAGELLWAERFVSGAYAMSADGTPLQLTPTLTLASQFGNS